MFFKRYSLITDLQLFDGFSSLADDQADFVGRDKHLLDGTVAVHLAVEARAVPTLLHDLAQKPLCLPEDRDGYLSPHLQMAHKNSAASHFSKSNVKRGVQVIQ